MPTVNIDSYSSSLNQLTVTVSDTGGRLYVYRNKKFILSEEVTSLQFQVESVFSEKGDSISVRYFFNKSLSDFSNSITVVETELVSNGYYYNKVSPFSKFFSKEDTDLTLLIQNLLKKIKLPGFILDKILLSDIDSQDFEEFWTSIIRYLLYYSKFSKELTEGLLGEDRDLLSTTLSQRGYILSLDESLEELNDIKSNLLYEISKRGTFEPFTERELNYLKQGEFLKLIRKDSYDDFLINLFKSEDLGVNIGNSSSLYRGLESQANLNKINLQNLYSIELTNEEYQLTPQSSLSRNQLKEENLVKVSPFLDYQLQFFLEGSGTVSIGVESYDIDGNKIDSLLRVTDGVESNLFVQNLEVEGKRHFTLNLFNFSRQLNSNYLSTSNSNQALILNENTFNLIPSFVCTSGQLSLSKVSLTPSFTPYSRGFIQTNNIVLSLFKNNSKYNLDEIERTTKDLLLPYNSNFISSDLETETLSSFPCQNTEEPNWIETGKFICLKGGGVNTGKVLLEERDLNYCTDKGTRWIDSGFDFEKCPSCLPNGVEVTVGAVTCDCLSVAVESFSCACSETTIETISCIC